MMKMSDRPGEQGFSLFELMIAMLLLAMISVMIYSVLNVGIRFSVQGGRKILEMERKYGFVNLVQSQIKSAVYDLKQKRLLISADDDILRIVTRNPFRYPEVGVVLAVYRYDAVEQAIYYIEKRDYYNVDYDDEFVPDFDEMMLLAQEVSSFSVTSNEEMGPAVTVEFQGEEYVLVPKSADERSLRLLVGEE